MCQKKSNKVIAFVLAMSMFTSQTSLVYASVSEPEVNCLSPKSAMTKLLNFFGGKNTKESLAEAFKKIEASSRQGYQKLSNIIASEGFEWAYEYASDKNKDKYSGVLALLDTAQVRQDKKLTNVIIDFAMSGHLEILAQFDKDATAQEQQIFMECLLTAHQDALTKSEMAYDKDTFYLQLTGVAIKFGTSGWRGQVGKNFVLPNIKRAVQGIAEYYNEHIKEGYILVGYDPRKDNAKFVKETAAILAANGIPVKIIANEPTPTPVLGYLANSNDKITGVINFTASHNPAIDDGIKFSPYHGGAADNDATNAIAKYANEATYFKTISYDAAVKDEKIEEVDYKDTVAEYVNGYMVPTMKEIGAWDDIVNYIKGDENFKVVIDAMQGTGAKYLEALYAAIAKDVGRDFFTLIHTDNTDSSFSEVNGAPNPTLATSIEDLMNLVMQDSNTLGLGVDGDSDRFGIVDKGGNPITSNDMMALLTYFFNQELGMKGAVGKTVATTNFVNAVAEYCDLEVVETAVGFKWFVEQTMKYGKDFMVAGEESAHVAAGPFMESWDDGIAIATMALWIQARTGKTLSEYKSEIEKKIGKQFFIKTSTFRGKDDSIKEVVNQIIADTKGELDSGTDFDQTAIAKQLSEEYGQKVVEMITKDGVKVVFESGDWLLFRPSGTEPAVKIYAEVTDKKNYQTLLGIGMKVAQIEGDPAPFDSSVETEEATDAVSYDQVKAMDMLAVDAEKTDGIGSYATAMLKGGVFGGFDTAANKVIKDILSKHFDIIEGPQSKSTSNSILTRWGPTGVKFLLGQALKKGAVDETAHAALLKALDANNGSLFTELLAKVSDETAIARTIKKLMNYLAGDTQYLFFKLKVPFEDFAKDYVKLYLADYAEMKNIDAPDIDGMTLDQIGAIELDGTTVKEILRNGDYKYNLDLDNLNMQAVFKGAISRTNPLQAVKGTVRYEIGQLMQDENSSMYKAITENNDLGPDNEITFDQLPIMYNTIHVPDGGEELVREFTKIMNPSELKVFIAAITAEYGAQSQILADAPQVVKDNFEAGVIGDGATLAALDVLISEGQAHLLEKWDAPGVNDDKKIAFLNQVLEVDSNYPGGLKAYRENAKDLLESSAKGENPFDGYTPEVPAGMDLTDMSSDRYNQLADNGLENASKLSFVMVAGGMGERLGYGGIKVEIPLSLTQEETYLAWYVENIRALQDKSNEATGQDNKIPFTIMTSNDTHSMTVGLLDKLGFEMISQNETHFIFADDKGMEISIVKQGAVPALTNNNADFALSEEDPYNLMVKPHGHGDIHMLLHKYGLVDKWEADGVDYTVVIQDTNGQVFNGILPTLGITMEKDVDFNFITVPREAGEAAGAITKLQHENGSSVVVNVEYNQLDPLLKATVNEEGDVADPDTGKSPYPANLNVFMLKNKAYNEMLKKTKGIIAEFVNPKYADETKTTFKKPTRLETMMQDLAQEMGAYNVQFTNFAKRDVFSPVKNNIVDAAGKVKSGNYPDSMATGEGDFYKYFRKMLQLSGMKLSLEGVKMRSQKVPYQMGSKVVLSPEFASTLTEVKQKVKGGSISTRSALIVDGKDIVLDNVDIDGALVIKTVPGVNLTVKDLKVKNDSWEFEDLTPKEMNDPEVPDYLKIRGYKLVKKDQMEINITKPGNYVVGADGVVKVVVDADIAEKAPSVLINNIENAVITEEEHIDAIRMLLNEGQAALFDNWDAPGVNDDKKLAFLDQVIEVDKNYSGGLKAYRENAKNLLEASAKGDNPFEGYTPEVPKGMDLTDMSSDRYNELANNGLENASKLSFVMVAGGMGERLGYGGIKVEIPLSLTQEETYLAWYVQNIKALQDKSNEATGQDNKIPFTIMTSNDTHDMTVGLLDKLGFEQVSQNETHFVYADSKGMTISIVKQGAVPALINNNADFALSEDNPYNLMVKPHGHGDIHMLLHKYGLVDQWEADGVDYTVVIQDTNGQVFNGILPTLGITMENDVDFNFITVPREAGEAAGAITKLQHENGSSVVVNVEYNQLDPLLKATVNEAGDVADPDTGKSPYPANLNVFMLKNKAYNAKLKETGGIIAEFVNPKYADETKTKFKKPTRLETMMQDLAQEMGAYNVQFTNFAKRDVFSPVKNNIVDAAGKVKSGNYPDSMATGEGDFYKYFRKMLELSGMDINVDGKEAVSQSVPYKAGAKVMLSPEFVSVLDEAKDKIKGGRITDKSTLVVDGKDVVLDNVDIDGALVIKTAPGVNLTVKNLKVRNEGWSFKDLSEDEMKSDDVPDYLKIRGYKLVKTDQTEINITKPGNYVVGENGLVTEVLEPLVITEINRQAKIGDVKLPLAADRTLVIMEGSVVDESIFDVIKDKALTGNVLPGVFLLNQGIANLAQFVPNPDNLEVITDADRDAKQSFDIAV